MSQKEHRVEGKQHKIHKVAVCAELLEEVSCAGWGPQEELGLDRALPRCGELESK